MSYAAVGFQIHVDVRDRSILPNTQIPAGPLGGRLGIGVQKELELARLQALRGVDNENRVAGYPVCEEQGNSESDLDQHGCGFNHVEVCAYRASAFLMGGAARV
jgi:hypothetical protein